MNENSLPSSITQIVIRLADEGIPVNVLARGFKFPSELVRSTLVDALASGTLIDMPPPDWPPTAKRGDRVPNGNGKKVEDEELMINCMKVFKVTQLQACLLSVLIRREEAPKETLHNAIEHRRMKRAMKPQNLEETDPKMVDVVVCHLRKKLKPFKLEIKTLWSRGYYMDKQHRDLALQIVTQYGGGTVQ